MSVTIAAYQDILTLSRPISKHPKMSVENRAKLFTPFSALRGFDIEILTQEQDRLLVPQESLSDGQQEAVWRTQQPPAGRLGHRHLFCACETHCWATAGRIHRSVRHGKKSRRCGATPDTGRLPYPLFYHPHLDRAWNGRG